MDDTRSETLKRWVKQPPAGPNLQYLRDAERLAAWDQLGHRERVLDLASEANVTMGLDAERVTRVDFADGAAAYAREVAGDDVDDSVVVDPEAPALPFADDAFDGAVSIGPYDWPFLDVATLTEEVRRVLADDGRFVFSTPTHRSPYAVTGKGKYRYYSPDEALSLLTPTGSETPADTDWTLADQDLIYQLPYKANLVVNSLPDDLQRPVVAAERALTDHFESWGDWDDASYLLFGAEPVDYAGYLDDALDCLFRPVAENGFWDAGAADGGSEGGLIRALDYDLGDDGRPCEWTRDDRVLHRYAPFALLGIARWRASPLGDDRFDAKLRSALAGFAARVEDDRLDGMPSYALGPLVGAFTLASDALGGDDAAVGDDHLATARALFEHTRDRDDFDFSHAEDSLLACGWAELYERTGDGDVGEALDAALDAIADRHDWESGLFRFDNGTTERHQNQMYALWGLCRAADVTDAPAFVPLAGDVLERTVERRMRPDGAFLWTDVGAKRGAWGELRERLGASRPSYWKLLFECHQTFFVNAVAHYTRAGGARDFSTAVLRAMSWMYGNNDLDADLVERSGIGVPMRFVTTGGRLSVPDQNFKGAYEVGSYVEALTHLLDPEGPFRN
ncbi:class I SAM-dependent methyltransferase [Halobium salinum]|uniref:Class I SAM-dependent methyltransferase n=1 Tax=Halobium salinum TaxID=1364940 RepID=A0ABD5PCM0_9EURY|nr:methyltransferase domain-containing protein [Halobium salinum]